MARSARQLWSKENGSAWSPIDVYWTAQTLPDETFTANFVKKNKVSIYKIPSTLDIVKTRVARSV